MLKWAERGVTPVELDLDPFANPRQEGNRSILFKWPYLIIEYIGNDTLSALVYKCKAAKL